MLVIAAGIAFGTLALVVLAFLILREDLHGIRQELADLRRTIHPVDVDG